MKRDLEFLFEIGALRLIPRQWSRFHLNHVQNLTEHHYRVLWLALIIASREGQGNIEKIMKMAVMHDIAESRTGDVDYLARQYVDRHEDVAIKDMLADTSLEAEFLALYDEYEARESIESKIVKDADNLDVDMEIAEQAANGSHMSDSFGPNRRQVRKTKFYTDTAKQLWDDIQSANPHDWHTQSPHNRLNGGDWRDESANA